MMPNKDPANWLSTAFLLSMLAALFGRAVWLGEKSERQHIWSWRLLFELPTAFCMALIGEGIAEHFNLGSAVTLGLISALSYLGPRGLIVQIERLARLKKMEGNKK